MLADIKKDARSRMNKSLEALRHELAKIRTGRAHPSLLEHVHVDYYGSQVPISQQRRYHYGWLTRPRADVKRGMAKGVIKI